MSDDSHVFMSEELDNKIDVAALNEQYADKFILVELTLQASDETEEFTIGGSALSVKNNNELSFTTVLDAAYDLLALNLRKNFLRLTYYSCLLNNKQLNVHDFSSKNILKDIEIKDIDHQHGMCTVSLQFSQ